MRVSNSYNYMYTTVCNTHEPTNMHARTHYTQVTKTPHTHTHTCASNTRDKYKQSIACLNFKLMASFFSPDSSLDNCFDACYSDWTHHWRAVLAQSVICVIHLHQLAIISRCSFPRRIFTNRCCCISLV